MSNENQIDDEWINQRETQLPPDFNITPDMDRAGAAAAAFDNAPIGEPPAPFSVRAVYDSRPVQGFDFNIPLLTELLTSGESATVSFVVPDGYVAVLREVHTWLENEVPLASRSSILFSLLSNGSAVPYNQNIPVADETIPPLKFFLVADAGQSIGGFIQVNLGDVGVSVAVNALFYGNFLVKTGVASPFEIANHDVEGKVASKTMVPTARSANRQPLPQSPVQVSQAQSSPAIATTAQGRLQLPAMWSHMTPMQQLNWVRQYGGGGLALKRT